MNALHWDVSAKVDFAAVAEDWARLNQAGPATILLDPEFVGPLLREFGEPGVHMAIGRENAVVKAIGFFRKTRFGTWDTFQPGQSPLGLFLADPSVGFEPALRSLLRALPGMNVILGTTQQDPALRERPADTAHLATLDYIETACITIDKSFEEYWKSRGRNLRRNLKRQRNGLERDGVATRLEVWTDPAMAAQAVADYGSLESAGWKAGEGTAIHPDNAQGRFYRSILEHFMARGEARVWRYFYNDTLVATDLCIERDGVLIVLKTTYDESQSTSAAHLMRQDAFVELFDGGKHRRIEFYGRVMDWHRKWSDEIRSMYHATVYRWTWVRRALRR